MSALINLHRSYNYGFKAVKHCVFLLERGPIQPTLNREYPFNKTAFIADDVTFRCEEYGISELSDYKWLHWKLPLPDTFWKFNGSTATVNSSHYTVVDPRYYQPPVSYSKYKKLSGKLVLTNVTVDHGGVYTCVVSNEVGAAWKSARLGIDTRYTYGKRSNLI